MYPTLPRPEIADCQHILAQLPSLRLRPEDLASSDNFTLTLGPLRSDPFKLPIKIRHGTCWISAFAF